MNRVVITGLGVIAPCGIGFEDFWENLESGTSFIDVDSEMVESKTNSQVSSRIKSFELTKTIPQEYFLEELENLDRFVQIGYASGVLSVLDSGLSLLQYYDKEMKSIIFSSAIGGTPLIENIFKKLSNFGKNPIGYQKVGPYFYNSGLFSYPANLLANQFGFNGIVTALSTGCTAGIDALGLAYELIKSGESDLVIAGSSEAPLCPLTYGTLDVIGCLSKNKSEPKMASRPFDKLRDGFVISEGAACVVLESLENAIKRKSKIYAEIKGFASVNNAKHMNDLPEDGGPMMRALNLLFDSAKVVPESIDYINAHGSSTQQNDVFETNAYKSFFGSNSLKIPISSTKSMIGHSLSSASLIGTIAAIGAIKRGKIHPTANYRNSDEFCNLNYVPNKSIKRNVDRALITASGFGGIHSAAIIDKIR